MKYICKSFGVSINKACKIIDFEKSSYYYNSKSKPSDEKVKERMKELADKYRRYGSPRIHVLLKRENLVVNHKRTERIYQELKLSLKVRKKKKRASFTRLELDQATRPNQRWSMDFVHDKLWNGRRFRMLNIIDQFTKECLAIEVDTSLNGQRVARVLDRIAAERGLPESIKVDNGPEFTAIVMDHWAFKRKVQLDFIRPGKPVENAFIESFNDKFRDECLNLNYFTSLSEAKDVIENWRLEYNDFRPHSSLNDLTPNEFAKNWYNFNKSLYFKAV